jgi:SET and MYND domain-containing protein 5
MNVWKQMHFPPETKSILLVVKILAFIKQSNDKKRAIDFFSQFCSQFVNENEQIVHKLLGNEFQNQLSLLRELVTKAMYDSDIPQLFTPESFLSLIAMIGTNGQGIGTSPLSCWVHNCDKLEIDGPQKSKLDQFIEQLYES